MNYSDKENNNKNKLVKYSCFVDNTNKFIYQGWLLINSLIKNAKISPENIYVTHDENINSYFIDKCINLGVKTYQIEKFGDKKYCNKIIQLDNSGLYDADLVVLMDTDMVVTKNFENFLELDKISGKIVDLETPKLFVLEEIFDNLNINNKPEIVDVDVSNNNTYNGNFNGGFYVIPNSVLKDLSFKWKKYAISLLNNKILEKYNKENHVDQTSFCLAANDLVNEEKITLFNLDNRFNFPLHLKNVSIIDKPFVIHYHWFIGNTGLIYTKNYKNTIIDEAIQEINKALLTTFDNTLFWNYRYETNIELGSGIGSKGDKKVEKQQLLKDIKIESFNSILDVGFGDLEVVGDFKLKNYTGYDVSEKAVELAKKKKPNWAFYDITKIDKKDIKNKDFVMCLDVLIHINNEKDFYELVDLLIKKTDDTLVVSGFSNYPKNSLKSNMCFFYESLGDVLEKSNKFISVDKVFTVFETDYYLCKVDKSKIIDDSLDILNKVIKSTGHKTDMNTENVERAFNEVKYKNELVSVINKSREMLGWYINQYSRVFEYPYVLNMLSKLCKDAKVLDFGTGIGTLPILLAEQGLEVKTIDNNSRCIRDIKNVNNVWGFFDYSSLNSNIQSFNESLSLTTFEENTFDAIYSVSVIEHMPADIRRYILECFALQIKPNGKLILTLDLKKDSYSLWNMSAGKVVEDAKIHGDIDTIREEIKGFGFKIINCEIMPLETERIDLALIEAEFLGTDTIIQDENCLNNHYSLQELTNMFKLECQNIIGKEVLLHVGLPKTKTCMIQEFLNNNREVLEKYNVYYQYSKNNKHQVIANALLNEDLYSFISFFKNLKNNDSDIIFISSEGLSNHIFDFNERSQMWIKALANICNVKVLITLRNQQEYLNSRYKQCVINPKNDKYLYGFTGTIEDFYDNEYTKQHLDYERIIKIYEQLVGEGNIIAVANRDFNIDYVLKILNINDAYDFEISDKPTNISLSDDAIEFVCELNKFINIEDKKKIVSLLKRQKAFTVTKTKEKNNIVTKLIKLEYGEKNKLLINRFSNLEEELTLE